MGGDLGCERSCDDDALQLSSFVSHIEDHSLEAELMKISKLCDPQVLRSAVPLQTQVCCGCTRASTPYHRTNVFGSVNIGRFFVKDRPASPSYLPPEHASRDQGCLQTRTDASPVPAQN